MKIPSVLLVTWKIYIKTSVRGWTDGSSVKHPGCSSGGLRFGFQHLHSGLQLQAQGLDSQHLCGGSHSSVIPVPGGPMPTSGILRHCMHVEHGRTHRHNTHTYKIKRNTSQKQHRRTNSFSRMAVIE